MVDVSIACAPWADPDPDPDPNPNPNLVLMYDALLCGCSPCDGACRTCGGRAGASKVGKRSTGKHMEKHYSMLGSWACMAAVWPSEGMLQTVQRGGGRRDAFEV